MDIKKLTLKQAKELCDRFIAMRSRAEAIIEISTQLAEAFDDIEKYTEDREDAIEDDDPQQASECDGKIERAKNDIKDLSEQLNQELSNGQMDFFVDYREVL